MNIFIITGQTATGKTKLALDLAQKYNGELVNCDSRQIYKHLDIITGKDISKHATYNVQRIMPDQFDIGYYYLRSKIWLYDVVDPKQYFSSYDYAQCALYVIQDILKREKTPIIVGGTYLYLHHLLYPVDTERIPPDWQLRERLASKTVSKLQVILRETNKESFDRLNQSDRHNPQRLMRKIEIARAARKPTRLKSEAGKPSRLITMARNIQFIGLKHADRQLLKQRIQERVEERLKNGAINEVKQLLRKGYAETDPGLKTIGYQQLLQYLKGKLMKEEAISRWITKEIQYAKRQYTFMKKDPRIIWRNV